MRRHVHMPSAILRKIRREALSAYPEECCGLLIGFAADEPASSPGTPADKREAFAPIRILQCIPSLNIAAGDRRRAYQIDWQVLLAASKQTRTTGRRIIGVYHSHPNGAAEPSAVDIEHGVPGYLYLIQPVSPKDPRHPQARLPAIWRLQDKAGLPCLAKLAFSPPARRN